MKNRILIVDDNSNNLSVLGNLLVAGNFTVLIAGDGDAAIHAVRKKQPDLILLDINLPGISGYEVCRILKEDSSTADIPIIFLTAHSETENIVEGFRLGAVDYVTKPFRSEELLSRVNTHLELRNTRIALDLRNAELQKRTVELDTINKKLEEEIKIRKAAEEKLEELNKELLELSITDNLTGIGNRRYFDTVLAAEWSRAKRNGSLLSLIIGDVDWFKKYNDLYGHQAGDECLKSVALILKGNAMRSSDLVARYGGEEFAVILPGINSEQASGFAEKVIKGFRDLNLPHAESEYGYVTMSFGIATIIPENGQPVEFLLEIADKALYSAKDSGRNKYVISKNDSKTL